MRGRSSSRTATRVGTGWQTAIWSRCWLPTWRLPGAACRVLVAQLEGIADGAGLRFLDVFAVNAFEELYAVLEGSVPPPAGVTITPAPPPLPVERCTDLVITAPGATILAHNEQWYAGDDGGVAVIVERPDSDDEVAIVAPASVGTLPLVGMNARGGGARPDVTERRR